MDQFASKWNCEELRIRYVSGLRNQSFFSFNHFRKAHNHPICDFSCWCYGISQVRPLLRDPLLRNFWGPTSSA
jgi:hypothetical protein